MLAKVWSAALQGLDGVLIELEVDLTSKLPRFIIVGLPDTAIREARYRVKTAMLNSKYQFPYKRILINLAPANIKKQGPQYDLPIAMGLLAASEQIGHDRFTDIVVIGELALDGSVRPVKGVISMVEAAHRAGFKKIMVPHSNACEAAISKLLDVYPIANLAEAVNFFASSQLPEAFKMETPVVYSEENIDYAEVSAQEQGKRAMLIAAAGGHHYLMVGPPGSGKTMLARRVTTILPRLTMEQAVATTRVYSIVGLLPAKHALILTPPFRAPHHTISSGGLAGGGSCPRPGELSLAHNGVLFLDELPEFVRSVLEVLRQPLEYHQVTISRAQMTTTYPSCFLLLAAMNPCPCGYLGDSIQPCSCSLNAIARYRQRISGPLLDRFDLQVEIPRLGYEELENARSGTDSHTMRCQVVNARQIQHARLHRYSIYTNSQMSPQLVKKYCKVDREGRQLLRKAIKNLGLSARAYHKILKVARTIADLSDSEAITTACLGETIQYRTLDRKLSP